MESRKQGAMPAYCLHKQRGIAYVNLNGQQIMLGRHGSPESWANYHRTVAEWKANDCTSCPATRTCAPPTTYGDTLHRYDSAAVPRFQALRLHLTAIAGLVHREQAAPIACLIEENRVLQDQIGKRRLHLTDDQRRHLAAKGVTLGRRMLARVATIVTPGTILRWDRRPIAAKWTYLAKSRIGCPGIMKEIRAMTVRMARDNPSWGYCRIQGELKKLDHCVARSTIVKTLKEHGIRPSPQRPTSWRTFLRSHRELIAAADFFTTEVWTGRGLVTRYVLFVIDHATRAIEIASITTNPDVAFMAQVARNLTDRVDGFLRNKHFLLLDRDTKFTARFKHTRLDAGIAVTTTAFQAPNMNAFAEGSVRSIKSECLAKLILFGTRHLERSVGQSIAHYHEERPHQGLGNELVLGQPGPGTGEVIVRERFGGLLKHYHRAA